MLCSVYRCAVQFIHYAVFTVVLFSIMQCLLLCCVVQHYAVFTVVVCCSVLCAPPSDRVTFCVSWDEVVFRSLFVPSFACREYMCATQIPSSIPISHPQGDYGPFVLNCTMILLNVYISEVRFLVKCKWLSHWSALAAHCMFEIIVGSYITVCVYVRERERERERDIYMTAQHQECGR